MKRKGGRPEQIRDQATGVLLIRSSKPKPAWWGHPELLPKRPPSLAEQARRMPTPVLPCVCGNNSAAFYHDGRGFLAPVCPACKRELPVAPRESVLASR